MLGSLWGQHHLVVPVVIFWEQGLQLLKPGSWKNALLELGILNLLAKGLSGTTAQGRAQVPLQASGPGTWTLKPFSEAAALLRPVKVMGQMCNFWGAVRCCWWESVWIRMIRQSLRGYGTADG